MNGWLSVQTGHIRILGIGLELLSMEAHARECHQKEIVIYI